MSRNTVLCICSINIGSAATLLIVGTTAVAVSAPREIANNVLGDDCDVEHITRRYELCTRSCRRGLQLCHNLDVFKSSGQRPGGYQGTKHEQLVVSLGISKCVSFCCLDMLCACFSAAWDAQVQLAAARGACMVRQPLCHRTRHFAWNSLTCAGLHLNNVFVWAPNAVGFGVSALQLTLFALLPSTSKGKGHIEL